MKLITYLLLVFLLGSGNTDAVANCDTGWTVYKDETCVKIVNQPLTYYDAKDFCTSQKDSTNTASLVIVKDSGMQQFLTNLTKSKVDLFWLGGKHDDALGQFVWEDEEPLTYTNWAPGYPQDIVSSDTCMVLRPSGVINIGNWEHESCQQPKMFLCHKSPRFTLEEATREIKKLQTRLDSVLNNLETTATELRQEVSQVITNVVPVGFIYVEYFNQSAPLTIWPNVKWEDVTASYAGLFFRALGGNAGQWGTKQTGCSPRIKEIKYHHPIEAKKTNITISVGQWSDYVTAGYYYEHSSSVKREGLAFKAEICEVRPRNQAIRIWKRVEDDTPIKHKL